MQEEWLAGSGPASIVPSRMGVLSCLLCLASLGAPALARADDWRVCIATAGNATGDDKHVHWAVTQPFEVSRIADWQQQYEAAKAERYAFARSRGWGANEEGFSCSEAMPDASTAETRHGDMLLNFEERREIGNRLGIGFTWAEWAWRPTASGASTTDAGTAGPGADLATTTPARDATDADDDGDGAATEAAEQANAERERQEAAAAEARRQKELADAKAEQDRLAREKARREREAAAAQAERERQVAQAAKAQASTDTDANRCVTSPSLRQNDTFQGNTAAYVTNGCGTPVDVRICLMKEGKGWNCGMTFGLQPQASWSWSSFNATGEVFMDARVQGSSRRMASP